MHELSRQVETLQRLQQHARTRTAQPADQQTCALTIALSREAGTPTPEIARRLGERLGWPVYDHELLAQIASDLGSNVQHVEWLDERHQSWLLECIEGFVQAPPVNESKYVVRLVRIVHDLAEQGHCIIVGRGAPLLLPARTTLRVRLTGDTDDRAAVWSRRYHIDRAEAARRITEVDQERAGFVQAHFHKNPADPHHYDLVVNTSLWPLEECVDLIDHALRLKQQKE